MTQVTTTPQDEAQTKQDDTVREMWLRMGNPKLQALRAQHPFVPIMTMPNSSVTFTLNAATPSDIALPQGTKLLYISATDEYYISRNGAAQLPAAAKTMYSDTDYTGSFQNPGGVWLYVEEVQMISFIAKNANTRVSVAFWQQL